MRVRYRVEIDTFGMATVPTTDRAHVVRNLSLAKAWRIVTRAARRGQRLHGGSIVRGNWGMRGGEFPTRYRHAVIKAEVA